MTSSGAFDFVTIMQDNISLGRWEDEEGNPNCNTCKCPLLMHMFGLGCGATKRGCQNPKCKDKLDD